MNDAWGRAVTQVGNVFTTSDGISVTAQSAAQALGTLAGMAPASYAPPPPPPPTTIDPLPFMARLTAPEQTTIATAAQSNAQIFLFLLKLSGAQTVDVTDALTVAGVNAMVTGGLLSATRGAQILDLSRSSP